jgi:thioredoxin 1
MEYPMLTRRQVLAVLVGTATAASASGRVLALDTTEYSPATLDVLQQSGRPFLIDFSATWCSTCAAQERVLEQLVDESSAYRAIPILRVDWDMHGNGKLAGQLAIPRRSTLVLMQGTRELGRLIAETRKDKIAALLDLAAA